MKRLALAALLVALASAPGCGFEKRTAPSRFDARWSKWQQQRAFWHPEDARAIRAAYLNR